MGPVKLIQQLLPLPPHGLVGWVEPCSVPRGSALQGIPFALHCPLLIKLIDGGSMTNRGVVLPNPLGPITRSTDCWQPPFATGHLVTSDLEVLSLLLISLALPPQGERRI